ncbi:MAG: cold shock domain-containing protein [Candidatus Thermoplasmatota archaeon]|nr:cold shock domain-containing protein [Candidatus Thermoplasmatota archaeon]
MEGTVRRWLVSYGFIGAEELDEDVFVHLSDVNSGMPLKEGQKVTFEIEEESQGPKAVNVDIVEE